ncbi:Relaxase/Mobilisation nuclease domain-containing protein [Chryseobacterium balustinum]|uniref:Relaxase/Mobilisation nuclease domain n=1 Tax=Chryseobacterium balustinum TaxID=246 RepID=A0AAX2ILW6_9FLAO|nr:Relaxase/Mobilisation nuclease domain-containing protein [Chryseobacterium balustinum]SQA90133.1 Relaxase/Mobilisation nuclease domain [Chryseobacterium balustinum]
MNEMGFGEQPFVVFKHTDISRTHIHIVSIGVDEMGKKISDKFEKRKSMKICREIERKYKLSSVADKKLNQKEQIFSPVDYQEGDIKSQMASVIRHIPNYYQFQTMGEYNALLSLYNIGSEKVDKIENGILKNGLLYFALNDQGEKVSQPFKASLFGKDAGLRALDIHFLNSNKLKLTSVHETLKAALRLAMNTQPNESEFKSKLQDMGISTVVRRNASGRIYGMTFIDHHSKSVWNGSRLGKEFSANAFHQYWNGGVESKEEVNSKHEKYNINNDNSEILQSEKPHELLNFFHQDSNSVIDGLGSIIPEILGEDYEELDFENRMKKKRKLQKPRK